MRHVALARCRRIAAGLIAAALALPGPANPGGLSGVVRSADGPIAGAFVAVTGGGDPHTAVTDDEGRWDVGAVPAGPWRLAAQAAGFAAAVDGAVSVDAGPVFHELVLAVSPARLRALGVPGGPIAALLDGGATGVFYALSPGAPAVHRTVDHGGTWTPVTLALDDGTRGLPAGATIDAIATSGVAGEVAALAGGTLWRSTDFGVTWGAVAAPADGPIPPGAGVHLHWAHAGATSVLLVVTEATTFRADMTAAAPGLERQAVSYLTGTADRMAVANGKDAAWVAVVRADGELAVFDLAENPPATDWSGQNGLPAPPTFVRLGGMRDGDGVPPDALLVYSYEAGRAQMLTKTGADGDFTSPSSTTVVTGCNESGDATGALAPDAGGTSGVGFVAQCLVSKNGFVPLAVMPIAGVAPDVGPAFDAAYDGEDDRVILAADGARGVVKSASTVDGVPRFPGTEAAPGTDAGSGGAAVRGLHAAVVEDVAAGPVGATRVAAILATDGGALGVASDDGGETFGTVVPVGGRAVAWWTGTRGDWLAFGHGGGGLLLTAVEGWLAGTPPLAGPNVPGSDTFGLIGGPDFEVTALAGIPGTDAAFVGGGVPGGAAGHLARVVFGAGPSLAGVSPLVPGILPGAVRALAYCPAEGSAASVAGVLLVAAGVAGDAHAGALLRIDGAAGDQPSASIVAGVPTTAPVSGVRVHCGSGRVLIATGGGEQSPGFWKSADGGERFTRLVPDVPGLPWTTGVRALAIDASERGRVVVAGEGAGDVAETRDGGGSWSVVNDTRAAGGRVFPGAGLTDLEMLPAADGSAPARVLVASGGGLFAGDLAGDEGTTGCTRDADCDDGDRCTIDACSAAACTATPVTGLAGAGCELGLLGASLCPDGTVDAALGRSIARTVARVQALLARAGTAAARPARRGRTLARARRALGRLARRIARRPRPSAACRNALGAQIAAVRALL